MIKTPAQGDNIFPVFIPRMSQTRRDMLEVDSEEFVPMIYNNDTSSLQYYDPNISDWVDL